MDLQVVIPNAMMERLRAHAVRTYPEECCGILVGRRDRTTDAADAAHAVVVSRDILCANAAQELERRRRFTIDPRTLIDVIRELRGGEEEIVGFYHSHPDSDARLSSTDLTFVSLWPELVWLVIAVGKDGPRQARAWWLSSSTSEATAPIELPLVIEPARALAS
jgi:proteasome lid subunit RPN8/RPN11